MENNKKDLYSSLIKAWSEFPTIVKNAKGLWAYENLPGVYDLMSGVLKENNLGIESITDYDFNPVTGERFTVLKMRVIHGPTASYSEWSRFPLSELPISYYVDLIASKVSRDGKGGRESPTGLKNQADGGTQTFHRRYQIKLIFNLCGELDDNDGNDVGKKANDEAISLHNSNQSSSGVKSVYITEKQIPWLKIQLSQRGLAESSVLAAYKIESFEVMTKEMLDHLKEKLGIENKPRQT